MPREQLRADDRCLLGIADEFCFVLDESDELGGGRAAVECPRIDDGAIGPRGIVLPEQAEIDDPFAGIVDNIDVEAARAGCTDFNPRKT